jgi:ribosomal protein L33
MSFTAFGTTDRGWQYSDQGAIKGIIGDVDLNAFGNQVSVPMYRLYNPNSGEHFYTKNLNERDSLVRVGWRYEQVGWYAPVSSPAPVYRLYNPNAGDHFYTTNLNERNSLVRAGWRYEGVGWFSNTVKSSQVVLYRAYNPNAVAGAHNYTTNVNEQRVLVRAGWRDEGTAWYGVKQ